MPSGLVLGLWDRVGWEWGVHGVILVGVWEGRGNAEEREREGGR